MARTLIGYTWESYGCHAPNDSHEYWKRFYDDTPWWVGWDKGHLPSHIRNVQPIYTITDEAENPYEAAFYEMATAMNLPAMSKSPKEVYENHMLPLLKQLMSR